MKDILNARIKHREPFRPFSPVVLEEATGTYFTNDDPSPFMLMTYPVRPEKVLEIPAPTHVDGTGRLQTIRRDQNQRYYDLIKAFEARTAVPVLLNTSFNENEPICCTPAEAVDTFPRTRRMYSYWVICSSNGRRPASRVGHVRRSGAPGCASRADRIWQEAGGRKPAPILPHWVRASPTRSNLLIGPLH